MNKKQIVCLWLGIIVFVLVGLYASSDTIYLWSHGALMLPPFTVLWVCIIIVTIGLIYTFRDKQDKKDKDD